MGHSVEGKEFFLVLHLLNVGIPLVFYQFRQLFYAASPLSAYSWDFSDSFSGQPL